MPDLTDELRALADGAARRAEPPPVAEMIRRGGQRARLRRSLGGLSAAAVAVAVVLAVTALLPSRPAPASAPGVQLAAWTVIRQADGTVAVTIRELRDPAGLQRRLRADGVPASVTFFGALSRSCQRYPAGTALINRVFSGRQSGRYPVMVIHPAALPPGSGVQISPPAQRSITRVAIGLVRASPGCTGS
jgi:hypothetical protein